MDDIEELEKLANKGDALAQNSLGLRYFNGEGVKQDYLEAHKWIEKAAIQEYALAQNNLGYLYEKGKGVKQNYTKAKEWYEKAANQGNVSAQYNLGLMYYEGRGVKQDYIEAKKWFEKAAEQEHALAQHKLAIIYLFGLGIINPDYEKAESLFNESLKNGEISSEYYVNTFKKIKNKKFNIQMITSIAEYDSIKEGTEGVLIKPDENFNDQSHTLYDIYTFKEIKKEIDLMLENIPKVKEDKSNEFEVFSKICIKVSNLIPNDQRDLNGDENTQDENFATESNLIGAVCKKRCICTGYAELLRNLCILRGIDCICVSSNYHTFNQVKIGKNWYYFDLTKACNMIKNGESVQIFLQSGKKFKSLGDDNIPCESQLTYESPYDFKDRNKSLGKTMEQLVRALLSMVSAKAVKEASEVLGTQRKASEIEKNATH